MKKQRGAISLITLFLAAGFVGSILLIITPVIQKWQNHAQGKAVEKQILFVLDAVKQFQADRYNAGIDLNDMASLPSSIDELMPVYLSPCTVAQSASGQCFRQDTLPWNDRFTYERELVSVTANGRTFSVPGSVIKVPMRNLSGQRQKNYALSVLNQLPNAQYDSTADQLTIRWGRIGSEVEHEALVARDGSTTLTGPDWDLGGITWLTNIKGLFLRNQDGSQFSVASGLQRRVIVTSGSFIPLHSCPAGHTPDLDVMIKSIEPQSNATKFTSLGAFIPYHVPAAGGGWHVYAKYFAKLQSGSQQWVVLSDAYLKVTQLCVQ
ncbi:type II secretion system protein [Vibrio europaeus]|uniref:type II secretion system protein n=1 Tax=Vibrio europaeus TaxID=300876 RepID=UPI00233EBAC6|nr:type II secretion system protein [Vibrio europaeus]MDC5870268.1 type II secretion system protein [Vibrio europaeus]